MRDLAMGLKPGQPVNIPKALEQKVVDNWKQLEDNHFKKGTLGFDPQPLGNPAWRARSCGGRCWIKSEISWLAKDCKGLVCCGGDGSLLCWLWDIPSGRLEFPPLMEAGKYAQVKIQLEPFKQMKTGCPVPFASKRCLLGFDP